MNLPFDAVIAAPFGMLGLAREGDALSRLEFLPADAAARAPRDAVCREAQAQLQAYFGNARFQFTLPLAVHGTAFQKRVWELMCAIPAGQVRTYGEAASELASAARAVGGACGANPLAMVIPCHRIVGAHGLGGFMGKIHDQTLVIKRWLLRHEGYTGAN